MQSLDHPLRFRLSAELHARPFLRINESASLSHFAVFDEQRPRIHESLLGTLCHLAGIPLPAADTKHHSVQSPAGWYLKWERHTEFSTFTFVVPRTDENHFDDLSTRSIPAAWFELLSGSRFSACRMELVSGAGVCKAEAAMRQWMDGAVLVGSKVLTGGKVYCDWRIRSDGFIWFLVVDEDFREAQGGRLLQRLYEIETYRMMALLALPPAQDMARELNDVHASLEGLMRRMDTGRAVGGDSRVLLDLTHLAVRLESLSQLGARFSASRAYEKLVMARIRELREERIEGMPTLQEFMERRFAPAMNTCRSVWSRQGQIAARLARAVDLLRTRVSIAQEADVTRLLQGMERTARHQLHLQHAVEGLSVAAISYYVLALAAAGFKALHALGLPLEPELAEGAAIAPVVLAVVLITRRARNRLLDKQATAKTLG